MRRGHLVAVLGALACLAAAADPADRLADATQEARARHIFQEVRCLVCQGQSIDDSDAELAGDLRRIVRGLVRDGRTDRQIRSFLMARYGEFVLFRPPLTLANTILWGGPFAVAAIGLVWLVRRRRFEVNSEAALSAADEVRLAALGRDLPP